MPTEKPYASFNNFPVIGRNGIVYVAYDTGYKYIWNNGYRIQNPSVKTIQDEFGNLKLPLETVTSITTVFNQATTQTTLADTDKAVFFPSTGNFFSISWSSVKTILNGIYERLINKQNSLAPDGTGVKYPTVDAVNAGLDTKQGNRIVVSSNTAAVIDGAYTLVATATFTDPTPQEGKGFSVLIRNGTATIGGTPYSTAGTTVWRIYHSGAWANYVNELALGFTPEDVANKATDFTTINNTLYPSVEAVSELVSLTTGTTCKITTGNQTTTSNIASNITGMVVALEANKRYRLFGQIRTGCNNTGGVRFASTLPIDANLGITLLGYTTSSTAFQFARITETATLVGQFNQINASSGFVYVFGEIETGATAGNFQMQFASFTNTQTSTIFQLGSWLNFTEL